MKLFLNTIVLVMVMTFCYHDTFAQKADTTAPKYDKKKVYGRARITTIMSAIVPGLGQVVNRKIWKVPIIYAGLAGFGYIMVTNQQKLNFYSANLKAVYDDNPDTANSTDYTGDQLLTLKTEARKYRDIGIIGTAIFYFVNIIDANVDAHLKTFDVSDDLSMRIKPFNNISPDPKTGLCWQGGITLQLNFK